MEKASNNNKREIEIERRHKKRTEKKFKEIKAY